MVVGKDDLPSGSASSVPGRAYARLRTMITTSEKATQKSITLPLLSVHHTSFLWALCQGLVLSTTQRFAA
jgi:hypothetical protein